MGDKLRSHGKEQEQAPKNPQGPERTQGANSGQVRERLQQQRSPNQGGSTTGDRSGQRGATGDAGQRGTTGDQSGQRGATGDVGQHVLRDRPRSASTGESRERTGLQPPRTEFSGNQPISRGDRLNLMRDGWRNTNVQFVLTDHQGAARSGDRIFAQFTDHQGRQITHAADMRGSTATISQGLIPRDGSLRMMSISANGQASPVLEGTLHTYQRTSQNLRFEVTQQSETNRRQVETTSNQAGSTADRQRAAQGSVSVGPEYLRVQGQYGQTHRDGESNQTQHSLQDERGVPSTRLLIRQLP